MVYPRMRIEFFRDIFGNPQELETGLDAESQQEFEALVECKGCLGATRKAVQ